MSKSRITHLANEFAKRSRSLGFKGKKRDELALEFFLGAASGLFAEGKEEAGQHVLNVAGFLIATRGFMEVERLAAEHVAT